MKIFHFGPWPIKASEAFYASHLSLGIVNLKPVVPGHVLVIPRRVVKRFEELTKDEISDMFLSAQKIGNVVEKVYGASGLTFTVQDGPTAGQTVPHVHVHILPRKTGDFKNNDDIYPEIDKKAKDMNDELKDAGGKGPDVEERPARSRDELAEEAGRLRGLFPDNVDIWSE
ncbi:hypothetical protein HDU76_010536 [Blyttiomyces sp. JEL0837]|nr:hypothetical protein HDU76_010536 [Blyttiomyces sp. JEL0837]